MTTTLIEDRPHEDERIELRISVRADELEKKLSYLTSAKLSVYKPSRVFDELDDFLQETRRAIMENFFIP